MSRQHWELFQSENPEAVQAKTDSIWEIPNLVSAAILSSEIPVEPVDGISSETLGLLQKETAAPKPVRMYKFALLLCETSIVFYTSKVATIGRHIF